MKPATLTVLGMLAATVIPAIHVGPVAAADDCKKLLSEANKAAAAEASEVDPAKARPHREKYLQLIYDYQACVDQRAKAAAKAKAEAEARAKADADARAKAEADAQAKKAGHDDLDDVAMTIEIELEPGPGTPAASPSPAPAGGHTK